MQERRGQDLTGHQITRMFHRAFCAGIGIDMDIKWVPLTGKTGYILAAGALIPTYILNEKEIVLIDSGMHYDPGLVSFLRAVDVSVYAVLQTHLHRDHVANNRILMSRFDTKIFAHPEEIALVRSAEKMKESWFVAKPDMMDKYLRTYHYEILEVRPEQGRIVLRDVPFEVVPLYGHSQGHLGFATPDGVLCTGDAILSPAMAKYSKMPYFEDIGESIRTIQRLGQMDYPYYALAHMEILEKRDMPGLARANIELIERINQDILDQINDPATIDEMIVAVMYSLGIKASSATKNAYVRHTLRRRVEYLAETGRLKSVTKNGVTKYYPAS